MPQIATREDAARMARQCADRHLRAAGLDGHAQTCWSGSSLRVSLHSGSRHLVIEAGVFDADAARLDLLCHDLACRMARCSGVPEPDFEPSDGAIYRPACPEDMAGLDPSAQGRDVACELERMGVALTPRRRGVLLCGSRRVEIPECIARHPGWLLAAAEAAC